MDTTVHVLVPLLPCCTLRLVGLQLRLKLGTGGATTVKLMLAVRTSAPLAPWAWMANVPVGAEPDALMVRVLLAVGVTGLGL